MARVGVDGRWLRVHVAICDIDQAWTLVQAIAEADRPMYDAKKAASLGMGAKRCALELMSGNTPVLAVSIRVARMHTCVREVRLQH